MAQTLKFGIFFYQIIFDTLCINYVVLPSIINSVLIGSVLMRFILELIGIITNLENPVISFASEFSFWNLFIHLDIPSWENLILFSMNTLGLILVLYGQLKFALSQCRSPIMKLIIPFN